MGQRIYYRREINVGFLIVDGAKLYPFENLSNRAQIDEFVSEAKSKLAPAKCNDETVGHFMASNDFDRYLRTPVWQVESGEKKQWEEWVELFAQLEIEIGNKIIQADLVTFKITGKGAQDPDTVDFIVGVLLDVNKSCTVNRLVFDHRNSKNEQHPLTKNMRLGYWDDAEYQISYQRKDMGMLARLFARERARITMPALVRSQIESISGNGTNELVVATKKNDHIFCYER